MTPHGLVPTSYRQTNGPPLRGRLQKMRPRRLRLMKMTVKRVSMQANASLALPTAVRMRACRITRWRMLP